MDIKKIQEYLENKWYKVKISKGQCSLIINKTGSVIATWKYAQKRLETLFDYYINKEDDSKDKKNMTKNHI